MPKKRRNLNEKSQIVKLLLVNFASTVILIGFFATLLSIPVLKMDLTTSVIYYCSFPVLGIIALLNGMIFVKFTHLKKFAAGILSNILLIIIMAIGNIAAKPDENFLLFLLKLVIIVIFGALGGLINIKKKRKFKV